MPTGSLPESGKKLWEKVKAEALAGSCKGDESCAAATAWKAVENAGWHKDKDGKWTKKSDLATFSLTIKKASFDPKTEEMRWRADASDTEPDLANDSMTHELFEDFVQRIESGELAPEEFRSDFWQGGMPYISVSHYPDCNGDAVPGVIDAIYIDGKYLKSKGRFNNTPLGKACWTAIKADLEQKSEQSDKVRISIAFLDWMHKHKSNGFVFVRESIDDFCPECIRELITQKSLGKYFLKGQLVQEALTRVPMNQRTSMEVDKSMTTMKEDAESIIGEELAEEIEKKAKELVGKSEALVVKSAEEDMKKECTDKDGNVDEECMKKMKEKKPEEKSNVVEPVVASVPAETSDLSKVLESIHADLAEIKSKISVETSTSTLELYASEIDRALGEFRSAYDEIMKSDNPELNKLQAIQPIYAALGEAIVKSVTPPEAPKEEDNTVSTLDTKSLVSVLSEVMKPVTQKLDLIIAQSQNKPPVLGVPERRSIHPNEVLQLQSQSGEAKPLSIREIARRSVGLPS